MTSATSTHLFAVVTGASSGIGYELARQFAQQGYDLLITAEDAYIELVADDIRRDAACFVQAVRVDLATFEGVEELFAAIEATGRAVDAIAINAGRGAAGDFTDLTDLRDELNVIDVNVTSTVHLAKRVLPDMVRRGAGRVLFTPSVAATMPGPLQAVYDASDAFVRSYAQAIREELTGTGVTVTVDAVTVSEFLPIPQG